MEIINSNITNKSNSDFKSNKLILVLIDGFINKMTEDEYKDFLENREIREN